MPNRHGNAGQTGPRPLCRAMNSPAPGLPPWVLDVQTRRLTLEQRRGMLISRDRAVLRAFSFARLIRDRLLAWPAQVGPLLAAEFDVDATALTVALERWVREHLAMLARERPDF